MSNEIHKTVTAETPYAQGGVFEASAFAKGDKWSTFWEDNDGNAFTVQKYAVVEGDTIESISEKFYGETGKADLIRSANPNIADPLEVGAELSIKPE